MAVMRGASLSGYAALAKSLGLEPLTQLRIAGLSSHSLDDPDAPVSHDAACRLLETSARDSGAEDFGLRMAAQRRLSNLGPISLMLRDETTAREALDTLCRYQSLLNPTLFARIEEHGDLLLIREDVLAPHTGSNRQSVELAIGVMYRLLRELLGSGWKPKQISFSHVPPRDLKPHRAFFGCAVDFNAEFNGLICRTADMQARLSGDNPDMARFARHYLDTALAQRQQSSAAVVRQLIATLLPGGRCTSQQIARHLGIDRRTLHRYLAREDQTFSDLLQAVRADLVVRRIQSTDLPLSEVASLLGFSGHSAFSYWFGRTFGCSVTQWRRRAEMGPKMTAWHPPLTERAPE